MTTLRQVGEGTRREVPNYWELQASTLIEALRRAADSDDEIGRWLAERELSQTHDRLRMALEVLELLAQAPVQCYVGDGLAGVSRCR